MRWRFIANIVGILLIFLALSMLVPLLTSIYYQDDEKSTFIRSMVITATAGLCMVTLSKKQRDDSYISQKEGMTAVTLAWTAIGLFGALPFYFSLDFPTFTDAFFESVSGFTTTGASVMTSIEDASKSLLFWRSFIQWIGGMGIIVLSLAILPFLGVGGIQLYKAEVPSPVPDKLTPRLSESAKILWGVYAVITLIQIIFLFGGGMSLFDATCHAFTTMPTGGFSTKNVSVAHYDSVYFDYVIVGFMILAGINFSLHYQMLKGKTLAFWRDAECRCFLGLVLGLTLLTAWDVYGSVYASMEDAFRFAAFQIVSILTTTGYATADYEQFPGLSQVLLFVCMFIGASAGSTGGGIKCARVVVCFKYCYRELFKIIYPRSISHVKIDAAVIPDEVLRSIVGFVMLYIGLFILSSVLLACMGVDMMTAFGSVAACIGNIGPGFGTVGPSENFAHLPAMGKWLLALCMLIGRLELYTVIILFVPRFWRN